MSKYYCFVIAFFFAVLAQCADRAPRHLIVIDGPSNYGKSTTARALLEELLKHQKSAGQCGIDYYYQLQLWSQTALAPREPVCLFDTWESLKAKFEKSEDFRSNEFAKKLPYLRSFCEKATHENAPKTPYAVQEMGKYDFHNDFFQNVGEIISHHELPSSIIVSAIATSLCGIIL